MDIEETSTIQSCLGAQTVSPRFDLSSKPDKTREISVVTWSVLTQWWRKRSEIVPECCKVGQPAQVKMAIAITGLFLSTIVGRSYISPPNTDNQIFEVDR